MIVSIRGFSHLVASWLASSLNSCLSFYLVRLSAHIRLVYFCIGSLVAFVYLFVVACLFVDQEERQAEAGCPEAATHSGGLSCSLSLSGSHHFAKIASLLSEK